MREGRATEAGFTLVETLIAIFVIGLITTAGGAMLVSTFNGQRAIDSETDLVRRLELASAVIRQDLANAAPRLAERRDRAGRPQALFGGPADSDGVVLGLVRAGWTNIENEADRGGFLFVDYRFENGALVRRAQLRPDAVRTTPFAERTLIDGLRTVNVAFRVAGRPAPRWGQALGQQAILMPDAVEFVMVFEQGGELTQRFLVGGRS